MFADIYAAYAPMVFRLCLRFAAGNRAWAEDVMHDVFIRLFEMQDRLHDHDALEPWLRTVAYRECVDRWRRERGVWSRVKQVLSATANNPHELPQATLESREILERIVAHLEKTPALERAAFMMRYLDDLDQVEIAAILEVSKGQVSKLLERFRQRLRAAGWEVGDEQ